MIFLGAMKVTKGANVIRTSMNVLLVLAYVKTVQLVKILLDHTHAAVWQDTWERTAQ
jgi:hypothetical protein